MMKAESPLLIALSVLHHKKADDLIDAPEHGILPAALRLEMVRSFIPKGCRQM